MKELVFGVESARFYPLFSTNSKNEYIGFARELFDCFGAAKGYKIKYKPHPISKIFGSYYKNEFDIKFPDNPFWDADNKENRDIIYSEEITEYIDGTMVEPEKLGQGVEKIKKLGILRGFTPFDYLDYIEKKKVITDESSAFHGLVTGILSERIDAFYLNVAITRHVLETIDQKGLFEFDPDLPHTRSFYQASSITNPEAIADLNAFLRESKDEINALRLKYKVDLDI